MKSTTNNELYFVNYTTLDRLAFQFVPMEVSNNRTHAIKKLEVVGRNHPIIQSNGGSSTLSFSVNLYGEDVPTRATFFKQFTYREGLNEPPPLMKIIWAGLIPDDKLWVVEKADVNYTVFAPENSFQPVAAVVTLSLVEWTRTNKFFKGTNFR